MSEITQGLIDLNGTLPIQIINFLILVALLRAVAYKPIVRMMDERKAKIAESIEKADADAAAAEATLNEYKAQLAAARTKAQEIVDMAEKRAGEEREASIQATKREIEQMKKSAEEQSGGQDHPEESGRKGQRRHHRRVHRKARREKSR